jgi:hypothetical protein
MKRSANRQILYDNAYRGMNYANIPRRILCFLGLPDVTATLGEQPRK